MRLDLKTCLLQARESPDDDRAWQAVGVAWLENGRASDAAQAFARALTLNPDNAPAAEGLVMAARQSGIWDPHLPALTQANSPVARLGLGLAAFSHGDMPTAADHFENALAADPAHAEAAYNLGAASANLEQWERAAQAFETFTHLQPREAEGWRGLGRARAALRQYEGAAQAYEAAVALAGDAAGCHLPLGKALGEIGRWQDAAESLRTAARLDAQSPVAFLALAYAYDQMARSAPHADARWPRDRCLRAEIGALEAALRLRDDDPAAWRSLARAREALGDPAGARQANQRASDTSRARAAGAAERAPGTPEAP